MSDSLTTAVTALLHKVVARHERNGKVTRGSDTRRPRPLRAVGVTTDRVWLGRDELELEGRRFRIRACASPLALRHALWESKRDGASAEGVEPTAVLLTPLETPALDDDVRARLEFGELHALNDWRLAMAALECTNADPSLLKPEAAEWLPGRLLSAIDPARAPRPSGRFLTAEFAWSLLLREMLGCASDLPQDLPSMMGWFQQPGTAERFAALPAAERAGIAARVGEASPAAGAALGSWLADGAELPASLRRPLPAGLLLDALARSSEPAEPGHDRRVWSLEKALGLGDDDALRAQQWAEAARAAVTVLPDEIRRVALEQADDLARHFDLATATAGSDWLPSAFNLRTDAFAEALTVAADDPRPSVSEQLFGLAAAVNEHRLATQRAGTRRRIHHALTLLRWLSLPAVTPAALGPAARAYAEADAWADAAMRQVLGAEPHAGLNAAVGRLAAAVRRRREAFNANFAQHLADHHARGGRPEALRPAGLIDAENFLGEVLGPRAAAGPVLLIVMDGMTLDLARSMVPQLGPWREVVPVERETRLLGLSPVPSVTRLARTTLLTGRRATGDPSVEGEGFAAFAGLRDAGATTRPPVLLHKADYLRPDKNGLTDRCRDLVGDPRQRVVGVVINAVDDQLSGSDQLKVRWRPEDVDGLEALLAYAESAERLVVLTSDHGHCVERGSEARLRPEGIAGGERWRGGGGAVGDGELSLTGPRVGFPDEPGDGEVVVPWSHGIRYTAGKSAGYHGGATPQELVTPIVLLDAAEQSHPSLHDLPADTPLWVLDPRYEPRDVVDAAAAAPPRAVQPVEAPTLFTPPAREPAAATRTADTVLATTPWIVALLASDVLVGQKQLAGRAVMDDQKIAEWLEAIASMNDRCTLPALATRMKMGLGRVGPSVAVLQRLLNVDGYEVLTLESASQTVALNRELLKTQFELETL